MSCFGSVATTGAYSSSGMRGGSSWRPWRWWRGKCAGIAASVGARLRRSIKGLDGRRPRRRSPLSSSSLSVQRGWHGHHHQHHHRSFAPVYVDELYNHHQPAKALHVVREMPSTSAGKLNAPANATAGATTRAASGSKATARVAAATTTTSSVGARAGSGKAARGVATAAGGVGAMRSVLMMSPGRGGGVLGVAKGMGEVDLRAELFIRKFKEDMRLQSQRSAEEFQAMLARGL